MKKFYLILLGILMLPALLMSQTCTMKGDVNKNGTIDIVDALLIAQASVGLSPASYTAACADVNCNSSIDIIDALLIAQLSVGSIASFPCQTTPTPVPTPTATSSNMSAGCGKDLTDLKSGTYKITSAGLNREYIINIPANYDKNKPYRLIFAMHCMGSSDTGVVNEKFYSLQPLAASANVPVIFVAPQGYTDSMPWRSDNKDHIFFSDMLKLFKDKLCVDTTRVFSCGFSFGAMFTYSLSLAFQDDLRAVAVYAPANYNIYLPTINHKPIAYFQTTGTSDGTCPWVNSDSAKRGGKYCVLQHIEDNGCPTPSNIPLATSGTHVSTTFPGCKAGYPVKFGSFQGGHSGTATDSGSNVNWIAKETWDFFMQF